MEIKYSLNKEDYYNFAKELDRSEIIKLLKYDIFFVFRSVYIAFALFFIAYFCCLYFFHHIFYPFYNLYSYLLLSAGVSVFSVILMRFNRRQYAETIMAYNEYYFDIKNFEKIIFSEENINIYSNKNVLAIHPSQIRQIFETHNYYAFLIETETLTETIIIPKRLFETPNQLQEFLTLAEKYVNSSHKFEGIRIYGVKYFKYISLTLMFVVLAIFLFDTKNSPKSILHDGLNTLPVVTKSSYPVFNDDYIILKINGKSQYNRIPMRVAKDLQKRNTTIEVIKLDKMQPSIKTIHLN